MPDEYYNSIYTGEEIDRRLCLAGEVANAVFFDTNATGLWASGAISSSSGSNSSSTTRIRTTGYISSGVKTISIAAGYKYMVFGYNAGTYMGTWNGSSFVKSGNWRTTDLDLTTLPAYDLRLVMATSPTDSTISTVAASNIALLAATDTTLTASGVAADAEAVGNEIYYKSGENYANTRVTGTATDFPGVVTDNNGVTRIGFTVTTAKKIPQGMTATVTRCNNVRIYGPNGLSLAGSSDFLNSNYTITTSIRAYNLVKVVVDREGGFPNLSEGQCIVVDATIVLRFS